MADMRKCIGSATFGIEAHEAPADEFPAQPSQKDGLGRMCKPHWNQYTTALRKAALARTAADGGVASEVANDRVGTGGGRTQGSRRSEGQAGSDAEARADPDAVAARAHESRTGAGSQGDAG